MREHFRATGFMATIKREPVLGEHVCRHTVPLGLRPSRKQLAEVRMTLCTKRRNGNAVLYKEEREQVLSLTKNGEPLVDAVELSVADPRLRPAVFMAAWGRWAHDKREAILSKYRAECEKPGNHPGYLTWCEELAKQKERDFERFMRAAIYAA
jgi:hypothetical protein